MTQNVHPELDGEVAVFVIGVVRLKGGAGLVRGDVHHVLRQAS